MKNCSNTLEHDPAGGQRINTRNSTCLQLADGFHFGSGPKGRLFHGRNHEVQPGLPFTGCAGGCAQRLELDFDGTGDYSCDQLCGSGFYC